jgi:hypothetical protein
MKLARFEIFSKTVRMDQGVASFTDDHQFFHYYDGNWFDESGSVIEDDDVIERLSKTLLEKGNWRDRKSVETYFAVESLKSVVVSNFAQPPKKSTRDRFHNNISRCLEQAQHEFDATHDSLTGLHNKNSFQENLKKEVNEILINAEDSRVIEGVESSNAVVLLSLDLDFFRRCSP